MMGLRAALLTIFASALLAGGLAATVAAQDFSDYGAVAESAPTDDGPQLADYGRLAEGYSNTATLDMTQKEVERFRVQLLFVASRFPHIFRNIGDSLASASPDGDPRFFIGLLVFLVFLIGIGRAVALVCALYVARPVFVKMQKPDPKGLGEKLPVLATRVLMMAVILFITLAVAVLTGSGFYPDDNPVAVRTAIIAFSGYAIMRMIDVVWRMVLAPFLPAYRVPVMSDRDARRLYGWLYGTTLTSVVLSGLIEWLGVVGVDDVTRALLAIMASAVAAALAALTGWINRHAVTRALLEGQPAHLASWPARLSAILWGPAVLAYLVLGWSVGAYRMVMGVDPGPPLMLIGFATFIAGMTVYTVTVYLVERLGERVPKARAAPEESVPVASRDLRADGGAMDSDDDEGGARAPRPARPSPPRHAGHRMRSYQDLAKRVASLFALGAAFWSLARFWGGPEIFAQDGLLDRIQDVIDILLLGYIVFHAVRIWIDRRIEEEGGEAFAAEPGDEGGGAASASRIATLLPLIRNFTLVLIVFAVGIFTLMEVGVNVAPLLGGAGVVGLAIGFGAQALVRDILSGAFFLIDDAFRRGEYIDVGEVKGTVEQISIRSFQLRHHLGALHTIPFGEIKHLTNFSRDWVMMKLPLRLTYDTDIEKVRKVIKKLGQELLEHPEEGHKFVQPLKSQGVYMMEDSAMIVRVKYMTKPGDQWTTRKLVYARIREIFEQEGIHFAHREVTVRLPDLKDGGAGDIGPREAQAIGAAARRAVDDIDEAALRPRAVGDDR